MNQGVIKAAAAGFGLIVALLILGASIDAFMDIESVQQGYRGVGMELNYDVDELKEVVADNTGYPEPFPPAASEGLRAGDAYENVQVLGDLTTGQFTRLMNAITQWVSPEQGCLYCHIAENLASDDIYTKVVSRRMIQMTQYINSEWTESHVKNAGVTCYSCHRGQPVPEYIWYEKPPSKWAKGAAGNRWGQNEPAETVAFASLPADPFTPFLSDDYEIRVQTEHPLPIGNRMSTIQTEWTYGLMMHMSDAMGVNCSYCHNTRSFGVWEASPPARVSAWHGIRMVRALNNEYLTPLQDEYPDYRLGPTGDAPKANCATCHYGAYKPLLGANLLEPYPSLSEPGYYAEEAAAAETEEERELRKKIEEAERRAAEAEAEAKAAAEAAAKAKAEAEAAKAKLQAGQNGDDGEGDTEGGEPEAEETDADVDDAFEPAD